MNIKKVIPRTIQRIQAPKLQNSMWFIKQISNSLFKYRCPLILLFPQFFNHNLFIIPEFRSQIDFSHCLIVNFVLISHLPISEFYTMLYLMRHFFLSVFSRDFELFLLDFFGFFIRLRRKLFLSEYKILKNWWPLFNYVVIVWLGVWVVKFGMGRDCDSGFCVFFNSDGVVSVVFAVSAEKASGGGSWGRVVNATAPSFVHYLMQCLIHFVTHFFFILFILIIKSDIVAL